MNQAGISNAKQGSSMSNSQYPRMKDRGAALAIPALEIGNSLLVIGHSSLSEAAEYPTPNSQYPMMKDRGAALAIPPFPFIPERCIL